MPRFGSQRWMRRHTSFDTSPNSSQSFLTCWRFNADWRCEPSKPNLIIDSICRLPLLSPKSYPRLVREHLRAHSPQVVDSVIPQFASQLANGLGAQIRTIPVSIRVEALLAANYPCLCSFQRKINERHLQESMAALGAKTLLEPMLASISHASTRQPKNSAQAEAADRLTSMDRLRMVGTNLGHRWICQGRGLGWFSTRFSLKQLNNWVAKQKYRGNDHVWLSESCVSALRASPVLLCTCNRGLRPRQRMFKPSGLNPSSRISTGDPLRIAGSLREIYYE
jgi:hypothetical protein